MTCVTANEYSCHKLPWICSLCPDHNPTGRFGIRVSRELILVYQELIGLPEHMCLPLVFSGVDLVQLHVFMFLTRRCSYLIKNDIRFVYAPI